MPRALVRWTALAVLCALVPSLKAAVPALEPAWQRSQARLGRPAEPLQPALAEALRGITPEQAASLDLPESRAALADALSLAGATPDELVVLLPGIIAAARDAATLGRAWQEPLIAVGPFTLTVAQLRFVTGPREGRNRYEVVARLRAAAPAEAARLRDEELLDLVPGLVTAADAALPDAALLAVRRVVLHEGADQ